MHLALEEFLVENNLFKLSNSQKNIWYIEKFYKNTSINNIVGYLKIDKNADLIALEKAINLLVQNHDSFRLCFQSTEDGPVQYVLPYTYFNIDVITLRGQNDLKNFEKSFPKEPIMQEESLLFTTRLLRFKNSSKAILVLNCHHLITDAWSMSITLNEIYDNYNKIINNKNIDTALAPSYIDYIKNSSSYLKSEKYKKDQAFWEEYFINTPNILSFKDSSKKNSWQSNREVYTINASLAQKIEDYCAKENISVYVFFLAIIGIYFRNISNTNNFIIANPILNRANAIEKQTTGMFVSIMPFIMKILDDSTFSDFAKSVASSQKQLYRHLKYSFYEILDDLRKNHNISGEIYDIVFSYQNSDIPDFCKWLPNYAQVESLQIHLKHLNLEHKDLSIHYDYLTDIFSKNDIQKMHARLLHIISCILMKKDIKVKDLDILMPKELLQFNLSHNQTAYFYPKHSNLVKEFEKIARKYPNNIAVEDNSNSLTYKELNNRANILAKQILAQNKDTNIIAFSLNRNINIYVAILGILKAGKTYMPIDPNYPLSRIEYMLQNSNIKILISSEEFSRSVNYENTLIDLDDIDFSKQAQNLKVNIPFDSVCYMMYTSGSTGIPKAVLIKHYNVINFANSMHKKLNYNPFTHQKVISVTTVCFDIFVFETFVSLLSGITIFIADDYECKNPKLLSKSIKDYNITKILTTPSRIQLLLSDNTGINCLKNVQEIILGGEPFTSTLLEVLQNSTKSKIYNLYGPTETCVYSAFKELTNTSEITIGTPIANTSIYILNDNKKLLPDGIIGEIAIGGDGVGNGYFKNVERTKAAFIKNPYGKDTLYLTGDLGYYNKNKELVCLGRKDHQIKKRGYRIELDDISNNILKFEGIDKCAVVNGEKSKKQYLAAYYTSKEPIDEQELLRFLTKELPNYMIPNYFVRLDDFPLTINHKIDKKALPEPNKAHVVTEDFVSPQTKTEKILHKCIRQELDLHRLSINYDLFNYNIDSLDIIRIQTKLLDYNIKINTQDFYKYRTVRELAEKIDSTCNTIDSQFSKELETINNSFYKHKESYADFTKNAYKHVLITGITGYLGIHVLHEFLENSNSKIIAVVRDKNGVSGEARLKELYKFYFGKRLKLSRIAFINTDITKKSLGLNKATYEKICKKVDLVINCAANVHYYGDYEDFKKINVYLTNNLALFCLENRIKFIHISTMGVSGNYLVNQTKGFSNFSEDDFFIGQVYNENVYIQTKFEAEKLLYELASKGLNVSIFRVGNLTGRYLDGHFQKNIEENAFYNILRVILKYNILPNTMLDQFLEFTPIDLCAKAIFTLSTSVSTNKRVFNIFNQNYLLVENLINILKLLNINVDILSGNDFNEKIISLEKSHPHENILKGIVNDLDKENGLSFATTINQQNFATNYYLEKLHFSWPMISKEYINKIIEYMRFNNYI